MHAAVWSQPTCSSSKFRGAQDTSESPDSRAGKYVLGVGIAEALVGGLLIVLGLTGFFVRDDNKRYLGVAAVAGLLSVITGISGCRAVSGWERAKSCTNIFTMLSFVNTFSCLTLTVMAGFILLASPQLLLTTVIAVSEAVLGVIGILISGSGFIVALVARPVLRNPLGAENARTTANRKGRNHQNDA